MSNQPRSIQNVPSNTTREVALQTALAIFNHSIQHKTYGTANTFADILVAEAKIIEAYLDEEDPQTGESGSTEAPEEEPVNGNEITLFLRSITGAQASLPANELYPFYTDWSRDAGLQPVGERAFKREWESRAS